MPIEQTSLDGKRILVTGGSTGIGRATVALLAEAGARVLTFARDEQALNDSLDNARSSGKGEVFGLTADASTREGIAQVLAAVDEKLGGIDMLVNNAALGGNPVQDSSEDEWRYVIETNLVGYMACANGAIERMQQNGGGHILFVSSISPVIKAPGESVYAATKAGIQAFAETLRKEVADRNIKITVIQPGSVATPMQEKSEEQKQQMLENHEMLYAEDIADAIYFALTRSERTDVVNLRIEPVLQKTS